MTDQRLPLPTDEELTRETRAVLAALPPLNLFRALAALPASLRPFLELGGSILGGAHLTGAERETAILRVADQTSSSYERHQHEHLARAAGLTGEQIAATAAETPGDVLGDDQALICRATDEITRDVRLSDEALALVLERWGPHGAAELILTVGYYNMVSRFLESARVPLEPGNVLDGTTPSDMARGGRQP